MTLQLINGILTLIMIFVIFYEIWQMHEERKHISQSLVDHHKWAMDFERNAMRKIALLEIDVEKTKGQVSGMMVDMTEHKTMIEERHAKMGELMRMVSAHLEELEVALKRLENK